LKNDANGEIETKGVEIFTVTAPVELGQADGIGKVKFALVWSWAKEARFGATLSNTPKIF
jgi:hypothetical protein